jgi:hypothetical protein
MVHHNHEEKKNAEAFFDFAPLGTAEGWKRFSRGKSLTAAEATTTGGVGFQAHNHASGIFPFLHFSSALLPSPSPIFSIPPHL